METENNSNVSTKYIQIKHLDYWASFYEVNEDSITDLSWVELYITDDSVGNKPFYWLEISNLIHCTGGDFYYGSDPEPIADLISKMAQNEIEFFVNRAIYPHKERFFAPETFENSTIFDHKHMESPHYIHLVVGEQRKLTPEILVEWLSKLSISLFGEQFHFEVTIDFTKISAEKAYLDELKKEGAGHDKFYTGEYFIRVSGKGTADLKIGSFMGEITASTNFPMACADACINILSGKLPVSVDFEDDFAQCTFVIDSSNRVYIIDNQCDETTLHKIEIPIPKLAYLLISDFKRDYEAYVNDDFYYAEGKKEEWAELFLEKIKRIEKLVKEYIG